MKKLLRSPSEWSFIARSAIIYDRTAAKIPITREGSSPFSDLCVKMKFQLTEPPQL